ASGVIAVIRRPALGRRLLQHLCIDALPRLRHGLQHERKRAERGHKTGRERNELSSAHGRHLCRVCRYARTLCTSSSVYFASCAACASSGLSTVNVTSLAGQERYVPDPSRTAIVNSSR